MQPDDLFKNLVRSSQDAIITKDLSGIVTSWNPAAERLFGYTEAEIVGAPILRLFPAQLCHEEDEILRRIRAREEVGLIYTRRLHKDGRELDVSLTISPMCDADSMVIGASTIARDARPWLESERRLRDSEANFEILANSIPQLAWMAEPEGGLFWYNRQWYEYTGTSFAEMEGWGWQKVHHPEHVRRVTDKFHEHLASGEVWEDTFPLRGEDGEFRWFLSRAQPIRNAAGEIVRWFGTNTDITEIREAGERVRLLLDEVNHRSKNMLGVVMALGRTSLLMSKEDFLERFNERLLSLSANQDLLVRSNWGKVPMAELVAAQLAFVRGAEGRIEADGDLAMLGAKSAEVIGMALHELATNALKYGALSQQGGLVSLSWRKQEVDGAPGLLIRWEESGGPTVSPPQRTGFGTALIREVPSRSLGETRLEFAPGGIVWELHCNQRALAAGDGPPPGGGDRP